jgi:hypothetical protein
MSTAELDKRIVTLATKVAVKIANEACAALDKRLREEMSRVVSMIIKRIQDLEARVGHLESQEADEWSGAGWPLEGRMGSADDVPDDPEVQP